MRFEIELEGESPIIMHSAESNMDKNSLANREKAEIAAKRGSNRTATDDARLRELECFTSLWTDPEGAPTIPGSALRATLENGAKKVKQGADVREGLIVEAVNEFEYDKSLGETAEELAKTVQFSCPVVVQRNRVIRTRAKFESWGVRFTVDTDDELVDQRKLHSWLDTAGRRVGLGDWRPQKSGQYGRFSVRKITQLSDS